MLHRFGVWYFEVGWIIASFMGVIVGTSCKRFSTVLKWCAAFLVIASIAVYGVCDK